MKPGESHVNTTPDKPKRTFLKPGEHAASSKVFSVNNSSSTPSWKKPGAVHRVIAITNYGLLLSDILTSEH